MRLISWRHVLFWCVWYGLRSSKSESKQWVWCVNIDTGSTWTQTIPDASEKDVTSRNQTHAPKKRTGRILCEYSFTLHTWITSKKTVWGKRIFFIDLTLFYTRCSFFSFLPEFQRTISSAALTIVTNVTIATDPVLLGGRGPFVKFVLYYMQGWILELRFPTCFRTY